VQNHVVVVDEARGPVWCQVAEHALVQLEELLCVECIEVFRCMLRAKLFELALHARDEAGQREPQVR
jgi:hypothetical protein